MTAVDLDSAGPEQPPRGAIATPRGLLATIGFLALIQAVMAQFVVHGIPLFLREAGHAPETIGLIFLAAVPYTLRFLWAPLIDRVGSARIGHFRGWILGGHALSAAALVLLALSDPASVPYALIAIIVVLMVGVATQMTATGGLMVEKLAPADRPKGAAVQAASAGFAGLVLGAAVLFLLADLGWQVTVGALVAIALAGLVLLSMLRLDAGAPLPANPAPFWSQFSILTRRNTRHLLVTTVLVAMGLVLTYGLKSIVLIDAGYSVAEAGLVGLVLGNAAGFLCALAARPVVDRWGGFACLAGIGLGAAALGFVFALVFAGGIERGPAAVFAIAANGLTFASFTASRSLIMSMCLPGRKATELAAFVGIEGVFILVLAGLGTVLMGLIGYPAVLAIAAAGSLCGCVVAWRARHAKQSEATEPA